jgi:hypothetical protein
MNYERDLKDGVSETPFILWALKRQQPVDCGIWLLRQSGRGHLWFITSSIGTTSELVP